MGGVQLRNKTVSKRQGKKTSRHGARRNIVFVSSTAIMSQCQITKWLFLFVYFIVAGLCNWAVVAYTHDFGSRQPLPDILFSLFPEQEWASHLGDYMVLATLTSFCVLLIFHQSRAIVARRFLFIGATLYAFRSITLIITQLPPGYENNTMRCREQVNLTFSIFLSRVVEQAIRAGFQDKTKMICGDMLFSGHTLTMVTSALCVAYYLPARWRLFQWIPNFFAVIGMTCLIISRTHYTIDIFIAYWLSNFVFRTYHAFCEVDIFMERKKSVLYGLWMLRIVEWLEDDIVPGRVENKFEFPLDGVFRLLLRDQAVKHQKQISIVRFVAPFPTRKINSHSSASTFNLP
ncbi:Phosphatidylcholine:ceramide cholinephosphotransferase 3 [Trichostrongylus colubriformis]|uniref:Phosphatidylcholine:ceramide cholinephosphotransferase 3 n=1 Tax=Trichostrongylus colubriformis TaxID=6319 RepID=A0AAN8F6G2_TRICO